MKPMYDHDLYESLERDRERGLAEIIRRYQDTVYSVAYSYAGDAFTAEDIMQTVLIKVYSKIDSFKWSSKLSTWIYRITLNACHDYARKKKNKKDVFSVIDDSLAAPERSVESEAMREEIRLAVKRLPDAYRDVVVLRYAEGKSCKEIAEILSCSPAAVDVRLFRARTALKEYLLPLFSEEAFYEV